MTETPPDARLLAAYAATRWEVETPGDRHEIRIGQRVHHDLRGCGIVTGWNPRSLQRPAHENESANRHLGVRLERAGATLAAAIAIAPDDPAGRWREPGFLVRGLGREAAAHIAAGYGQNAIVWIGADGLPALVAARDGFGGARTGDPIALPDPS